MHKLWLHVFILSDLLKDITRANSINVSNVHFYIKCIYIYIRVYLYIHVQVYDICTVNVCVVCV